MLIKLKRDTTTGEDWHKKGDVVSASFINANPPFFDLITGFLIHERLYENEVIVMRPKHCPCCNQEIDDFEEDLGFFERGRWYKNKKKEGSDMSEEQAYSMYQAALGELISSGKELEKDIEQILSDVQERFDEGD